MKIVREPQILSGFLYEDPFADWPAFTHCGEAVCAQRLRLKPHQHRGFEFLYMCRGECTWQIEKGRGGEGGGRHHQGMGDLFVAYPGQVHWIAPVPHSELAVLWVGMGLDQLGPEPQRLGKLLQSAGRQVITQCHELEPLLRGIVLQVTSSRPGRREVVAAYFATIMRLVQQRLDATPTGPDAILPYSYVVQKAIRYLEVNLNRRVPLAEIAEVAGCGLSQLCARFRTEVGCAPAEHHLRLRLALARQTLGSENVSVTATAFRYGFSSSQHLGAAFRGLYGVSPRQWRQGTKCKMQNAKIASGNK